MTLADFTGLLFAFLLSGGYLLVWPIYRLAHRRKSPRRQALLKLFLIEATLYFAVTGFVLYGFWKIPDFHHAFILFEILYFFLAAFCWLATFGVWADSSPDAER